MAKPLEIDSWWSIPKDSLIKMLALNVVQGLSKEQIESYRHSFGQNILEEKKPTKTKELIINGIKEPMMILLLSIAAISFLFEKSLEAIFMMFIVAMYILVEFSNKFRADHTMARLRELIPTTTKVIRDAQIQEIRISDIVVGDIIILSEGAYVPADIRLIESYGLLVDESTLTGESIPARKDAKADVDPAATVSARKNSVFSGTAILAGEGKGIVMAVGARSELGVIAHNVQTQKKDWTFIQEAMSHLVKILALIAIAVSLLIPTIGFLRGLNAQEMFLTWLTLTFLMIPGQPPIIIAISLALTSFALANKKVVVKRLQGVETLGQVTVIVTDKTGTLTENKMKVRRFILPDGKKVAPQLLDSKLKNSIALCLPKYSNDPTDKAIAAALDESSNQSSYDCLESFTNEHPWRSLIYTQGSLSYSAIAGQPEALIKLSSSSSIQEEALLKTLQQETNKGNRVAAFALKNNSSNITEILALAVLYDPIRPDVKMAVASLAKAGIVTYIVTGDHSKTAAMVARTINIDGDVLEGKEIDKIDDETLSAKFSSVKIFARTSPTQKQRLVRLLKQKNQIVAAVGDGVNDAPALKTANVSIAMGKIGTDLAKEAADLILVDDNYAYLPEAIALGRRALDNFRKGLTYYLTAKAILLFIFLIPLILGIPFPFAPIYIIVTKLFMDLAITTIFVTEAAEPDTMTKKPKEITNFINLRVVRYILKNGTLLAIGILAIYLWLYYKTHMVTLAQTAAFVTWLIGHVMLALNTKQERLSLFKQGVFSNNFATLWLAGMFTFSLAITTIPLVQAYLHTTFLNLNIWIAILLVAFSST